MLIKILPIRYGFWIQCTFFFMITLLLTIEDEFGIALIVDTGRIFPLLNKWTNLRRVFVSFHK
uniref:Uncharacterized protein n=1 Tax=Romanomermis culicivorax TaxID=13658 RepID=A0A915I673_ROMCU